MRLGEREPLVRLNHVSHLFNSLGTKACAGVDERPAGNDLIYMLIGIGDQIRSVCICHLCMYQSGHLTCLALPARPFASSIPLYRLARLARPVRSALSTRYTQVAYLAHQPVCPHPPGKYSSTQHTDMLQSMPGLPCLLT